MRNPDWSKEEVILALDLYFKLERGQMDGKNPEVIKLSEDLRAMNIHSTVPQPETFRSANSVSLKLANLKRLDNSFSGSGMKRGSIVEETVWDELANDRPLLSREVERIRNLYVTHDRNAGLQYENEITDLIAIQESESQESITSKTEGGKKVIISSKYEREPALRAEAFKHHGYECAVCGFNYERAYGAWGKGFAEVHHVIPLSENKGVRIQTSPKDDLIVLCANCHRMVHRKKGITLTVEELKKKLLTNCGGAVK